MKKFLVTMGLISCCVTAFACTVDLTKDPIMCNKQAITSAATLADVRKHCAIDDKGRFITRNKEKSFEVEFVADGGREYRCIFKENISSSVIKLCNKI